MAYTFGTAVTVVEAWGGQIRVGIEATKTSETSTSVTYSISVVPRLKNYHGLPHHYFYVTVDGVSKKAQNDVYMANNTYGGDNNWYTSTDVISPYSDSVTFTKGSSQKTVSISAALGTNYGYYPVGQSIWVSEAEATHSVDLTIPKKASSAHVKASGTWKDAQPYVKVSGSWKEATFYTKVSGSWKEGV